MLQLLYCPYAVTRVLRRSFTRKMGPKQKHRSKNDELRKNQEGKVLTFVKRPNSLVIIFKNRVQQARHVPASRGVVSVKAMKNWKICFGGIRVVTGIFKNERIILLMHIKNKMRK